MATTGTRMRRFGLRSVVAGGLAGAAMLGFYVALGAGGAAAFLYDYKLLFVLVGVGINALGVVVAARHLRRTPLPAAPLGGPRRETAVAVP